MSVFGLCKDLQSFELQLSQIAVFLTCVFFSVVQFNNLQSNSTASPFKLEKMSTCTGVWVGAIKTPCLLPLLLSLSSQSYDKCFLGSSETADANRVFCGQLGAIYVFSEALNPAQIFAIHQLGPSYKVCISPAEGYHLVTYKTLSDTAVSLQCACAHTILCVMCNNKCIELL